MKFYNNEPTMMKIDTSRPRRLSEQSKKCFVGHDRGSIGLLDVAVAMMITGILTVVLMAVISSAYSTTSAITERANYVEQNVVIGDRLRAAISGASPQGGCIDRINPANAVTVSNCRHLTESTTIIVSGTTKKVCVLAGQIKGLDTVTGAPSTPVLLKAQDTVCVELDSAGVLLKTRQTATSGSTEYASNTWTGNVTGSEIITALADDATFTYYDAEGTSLTVSTTLTSDQLKNVRRIKFTATLTAKYLRANERTNEKVSYEFAVGAGRFKSEQKWDGR